MPLRVIVQAIDIRWSKASRGGAGAQARARLPRGEVISIAVLESEKELEIQALEFCESNKFAPQPRQNIWTDGRIVACNIGCARLVPSADGLEVRFEYNESHGGLPFRSFSDPVTGCLALSRRRPFD